MILVEDIGHLLPNHRSGKIVGIASHRGGYIIVACEHGLYKLWDDGIEIRATPAPPAETSASRCIKCGSSPLATERGRCEDCGARQSTESEG